MLHLITWLPHPYQFAMCRALSRAYPGAFTAWFAQATHPEYPYRGLPDHDFPVRFLDRDGYRPLWHALRNDPEAVVVVGGWRSPMAVRVLTLTTLLRVPLFIWSDHPHPRPRTWLESTLRNGLLQLLSRHAAGMLAMGEPTRQHLISLGMPQHKVHNFPACTEIPALWTPPPYATHDSARTLRACAVGRQIPVKRLDTAIRAVAEAAKHGAEVELVLVGDGPERTALEAVCAELGCADRVRFPGWLDEGDVRRQLQECDVLIVPSEFEGYGLVVLEAMAAGRPVLASDVLVAARDRADGSDAVQFHEVGDARTLASQLARFVHDRELLLRAAHASRAIALQWPPDRAADILDRCFRQLKRYPRREVPAIAPAAARSFAGDVHS